MLLDQKLKQAALSAGLKHLLRGGRKSTERICRNILELGSSLADRPFSTDQLAALYEELQGRLAQMDLEEVRQWVIGKFGL